jgi:hypothetical protein
MRGDVLRGALLGLGVLALYVWSGHYWIDLVDEGYFLDLAQRVTQGAVPYRDFSTYYTPGIFGLFAAVMNVFGVALLPIRFVMAGLHAVLAMLLYGLTRRLTPWPWAVLPTLAVVALDHWPIEPEPHPSWPAVVACLATMELVARHHTTGKARWLVLAGAMAGVSFLFKQNVGAFTALGVAGYVVLRPRLCSGRVEQGLRALFALALGALVTLFLWPALDERLALAIWLPVLAAIAVAASAGLSGKQASFDLEGDDNGPDAKVTGWRGLASESLAAGLGFAVVTLAWLIPLSLSLGLHDLPLGLFLGSIDPSGLLIRFEEPSIDRLHLYLPGLAAWAAILALLATRTRGIALWYVLFGALALLAIYPRADAAHTLMAAPPILVGGAWALSRVRPRLLQVALLGVPLLAVAPQAAGRVGLMTQEPYESLRLEQAGGIMIPRSTAEDVRGVVGFVQAGTPPGEPLFVYPAAPLLNFLAERPSPSRFDHFFPRTLSEADLATVIGELEQARPRYVIWDHGGVVWWGTDPANRTLSDYIWTCYRQVAAFHLFLVLERRTDAC